MMFTHNYAIEFEIEMLAKFEYKYKYKHECKYKTHVLSFNSQLSRRVTLSFVTRAAQIKRKRFQTGFAQGGLVV